MSNKSIKEIMKYELAKSASDPIHFFKKYCYISHPQRGKILFNLYPFQEKALKLIGDNPYSIILKSRQLGISTLSAGYALWLMLFHNNKTVMALATTQATARNLVQKVQFMYENLPSWMKVESIENNRLSLKLKNGSRILAKSSSPDAARSEAVSLLIIDEAAFIDNVAETWASAQQTLATGGGAIVLSTPNGTGNWFHQMWSKAESSQNDFLPIKLPWYLHPERDEDWRKKQDELLGDPRLAAQECDCDFSTSGNTVFYGDHLDFLAQTTVKEPVEKRGTDAGLWIWEYPDYTKDYVITADVARGDGADYSTAHVMDVETNTQIAEYKGQLTTKDFGNFLVGLATEYNQALLVVENASVGWAAIQQITERGYPKLYHTPKNEGSIDAYFDPFSDYGNKAAGFTMSLKTRPIVVQKFVEYVAERSVTIQSKRLIEEMKTFIWKNGKAEAQPGYNDDLVMAFGMAMYIRDTALKFRQRGLDITKASLSNISVNRTVYQGAYNNTKYTPENPYKIDTGAGSEDIGWLL
jgi:hypothetical protein